MDQQAKEALQKKTGIKVGKGEIFGYLGTK